MLYFLMKGKRARSTRKGKANFVFALLKVLHDSEWVILVLFLCTKVFFKVIFQSILNPTF